MHSKRTYQLWNDEHAIKTSPNHQTSAEWLLVPPNHWLLEKETKQTWKSNRFKVRFPIKLIFRAYFILNMLHTDLYCWWNFAMATSWYGEHYFIGFHGIYLVCKFGMDQWLFLVPVKGGRWHIIPQLAVYTTYIPLIVLAFWGVKNATHPTFFGNQKRQLNGCDPDSIFLNFPTSSHSKKQIFQRIVAAEVENHSHSPHFSTLS